MVEEELAEEKFFTSKSPPSLHSSEGFTSRAFMDVIDKIFESIQRGGGGIKWEGC